MSGPERVGASVRKLRRATAVAEWRRNVLWRCKQTEGEQSGRADYPLRRTAWNDWIDAGIKGGMLPATAGEWAKPRECNP